MSGGSKKLIDAYCDRIIPRIREIPIHIATGFVAITPTPESGVELDLIIGDMMSNFSLGTSDAERDEDGNITRVTLTFNDNAMCEYFMKYITKK